MLALIALLLAAPASAEEPEERALTATVHGDVKAFIVAGFPHAWLGIADDADPFLEMVGLTEEEALEAYGLSADPFGVGTANGRLKLRASLRDRLNLDAHLALTAGNTVDGGALAGMSTGAGLSAPEALPLTWLPDTGSGFTAQGRVDRLVLTGRLPHVDVALGRQPVSFGTGFFFTPMDLVNPFHPATIDTEYKPGVDALRVDAYAGVSSQLTLAVAWAGDAPLVGEDRREEGELLSDLVLAAAGQTTLGVTDVLLFVGDVHAEPVLGLGARSGIGPVGVHGEVTLTMPDTDDAFVRAVVGADGRPTTTTTLMGELYVQSFGADEPEGYLDAAKSERFSRGEIWQMGRTYAALSVAQEVTPLVHANLALIGNVEDPSALAALGVSWSVSDDAVVVAGVYAGLGQRPETVDLQLAIDPVTGLPGLAPPTEEALAASVRSEFGLYPTSTYLQIKTWF